MDEYVTQIEYKERQARLDDENRRQNHRIDKLEQMYTKLTEISMSVKEIAVKMEGMQENLDKYGSKIDDMEKKPAENWDKLVYSIIAMIATAAVTWVIAKGGI